MAFQEGFADVDRDKSLAPSEVNRRGIIPRTGGRPGLLDLISIM